MNLRNRNVKDITNVVSSELSKPLPEQPDSEIATLQENMASINLADKGGVVLHSSAKVEVKDAIALSKLFDK